MDRFKTVLLDSDTAGVFEGDQLVATVQKETGHIDRKIETDSETEAFLKEISEAIS